jgi:hypothetical protein
MIFRKIQTWLVVTFLGAMVISGWSKAEAQDIATGQATANLLAVLSVSSTHDLDFGDVMQGVPEVASKTDNAQAGVFQISGEGGKEVSMHLDLPAFLWNSTNEDRMKISFDTDDADLDSTVAGTPAVHGNGAIVDQDPHNLPDTFLGGADDILQIFLGGTVEPAADQRAGAYTADIVLTVAYTGS